MGCIKGAEKRAGIKTKARMPKLRKNGQNKSNINLGREFEAKNKKPA
jgi:hypothetical protein